MLGVVSAKRLGSPGESRPARALGPLENVFHKGPEFEALNQVLKSKVGHLNGLAHGLGRVLPDHDDDGEAGVDGHAKGYGVDLGGLPAEASLLQLEVQPLQGADEKAATDRLLVKVRAPSENRLWSLNWTTRKGT